MNRIVLLIISVICVVVPMFAQPAPGNRKMDREFKEFKIRYLSQEMELNESQRQRFNEVYSQMMDEKKKVMDQAFALKKKLKSTSNPTEADYKAVSEAFSNAQVKNAEIDARYEKVFSKFLSAKQIYQMQEAEHKFRDTLAKMKKNHRKKHRN